MESFIIKALQLILSLSILVVMHELGHFAFSKLFRVRIEKFYLFFNPSFSIFRMKKIGGKWRFKCFSRNDSNVRRRYNYEGNEIEEVIPAEQLPADNWKRYPETTEWGIGWLPLGGYVKIAGMIDESFDKEQLQQSAQTWEYRSQKTWKRLLITTGGVLVNFVLALAIYSAVLFTWGNSYVEMRDTPMQFSETALSEGFRNGDCIIAADGKDLGRFSENAILSVLEAKTVTVLRNGETITLPMPEGGLIKLAMRKQKALMSPYLPAVVDSIMPDAPAAAVIKKGDKFLVVEKDTIHTFSELRNFLSKNDKKSSISAIVLRGNDTLLLDIPLDNKGLIGFAPQKSIIPKTETFDFWQSIPAGIDYGIQKLSFYVNQLKFLFSKEGVSNLSGFGGIGSMFAPAWDWMSFWENTAFLSIILAFMNILPIPALDGGHVLFLLYEMIFRRKPSDKFLIYAQTVGMILLLALVLYANGMDFVRAIF
ncbi:zinc metalloprotease [Bacteroidia bacterium]|nr:zinc metalloprotease [Bacteroidia bacterium]